jgi:hypothetical protein
LLLLLLPVLHVFWVELLELRHTSHLRERKTRVEDRQLVLLLVLACRQWQVALLGLLAVSPAPVLGLPSVEPQPQAAPMGQETGQRQWDGRHPTMTKVSDVQAGVMRAHNRYHGLL